MKDDVFWSGTERRRGRQRKGSVDVKVVDTQGQAFTVCRREMEETKVPCPLDSRRLMVLVLTSPRIRQATPFSRPQCPQLSHVGVGAGSMNTLVPKAPPLERCYLKVRRCLGWRRRPYGGTRSIYKAEQIRVV